MVNNKKITASADKTLHSKAFGAMAGVFLSRASGVVRTFVVNATFGIGIPLDAFNAAFRFPNSLRDLFADGALSSAFIKVFVDAKEKGIEEERKLISIVIGFFSFVTFTLAVLAAFFSYPFMDLMTSEKFKAEGGLDTASFLFKILAFYLPFTMLNAVAMAILGVLGKTFRAMNSSLFLSVGMIVGALIFAPLFQKEGFNPVTGLATGSMLGVILQLIYQFKPLFSLGLVTLPNISVRDWISYKPLKEVLILMTPRAIGQGALTIALLINTMFAIQVGNGVLTYVVTAVMIIQVPIGLFGVATGFAAQPVLTQALNENQEKKFSKLLVESLDLSLWLALLTTACFALLIVPFYAVLFQHGKVTFYDTIQNSVAVCAYSTGILFSSGSKVFVNAIYALNATKRIVYNALIYVVINIVLNIILVPKLGILGLGLSYGTASAVDFFLNYYSVNIIFRRKYINSNPFAAGGKMFPLKIGLFTLLAYIFSLGGVAFIYFFWERFELIFQVPLHFWLSFIILAGGGGVFALISLIATRFLGPSQFQKLLKRKL